MEIGRPTLYNEETIPKTLEYLNTYEEQGDVVPMVEGLAIHLGVSRETIYDWASQESKKDFSDIVDILRTTKSRGLQNKALKKEIDTKISALLLGHEGYREKHDVTTDDKPIENKTIVSGLDRVYGGSESTGEVSEDS